MLAGSFAPFLTAAAGEKLIHTIALPIGSESMSRIVTVGLVVSTILAIVVEYVLLLLVADRFASRVSSAPVSVSFDEPDVGEAESAPEKIPGTPSEDALFDEFNEYVAAEDSITVDGSAQTESAHESFADVIAEPDFGSEPDIMTSEVNVLEVEPAENFAEPFAERENNDSGDFEVSSPATSAASIVQSSVETPTYVDFEKMRAPFDLPVIEDWVPSEESPADGDEVQEDVLEEEISSGEPVDEFSEPVAESAESFDEFASATSDLDEEFSESTIESPAVSAFDPPLMEDFDEDEESVETEDPDWARYRIGIQQ